MGLYLEIEAPPQGRDLEAMKMSLLFFIYFFNLTSSSGGDFRPLQTFVLRPFTSRATRITLFTGLGRLTIISLFVIIVIVLIIRHVIFALYRQRRYCVVSSRI